MLPGIHIDVMYDGKVLRDKPSFICYTHIKNMHVHVNILHTYIHIGVCRYKNELFQSRTNGTRVAQGRSYRYLTIFK